MSQLRRWWQGRSRTWRRHPVECGYYRKDAAFWRRFWRCWLRGHTTWSFVDGCDVCGLSNAQIARANIRWRRRRGRWN